MRASCIDSIAGFKSMPSNLSMLRQLLMPRTCYLRSAHRDGSHQSHPSQCSSVARIVCNTTYSVKTTHHRPQDVPPLSVVHTSAKLFASSASRGTPSFLESSPASESRIFAPLPNEASQKDLFSMAQACRWSSDRLWLPGSYPSVIDLRRNIAAA
ncbi:hypothetical protein BDW02DRAFT_572751 [Decorospora gaudefroyi]|uniref:Uncharacterized protein n=1 Tax=Decorospora gaudefroyi TaxID=184978 RepID=A0A6A5K065_9PLEO|nr:hypothetical protein BDW02DRAFT_572751 [Decorospora gaudefroyi]